MVKTYAVRDLNAINDETRKRLNNAHVRPSAKGRTKSVGNSEKKPHVQQDDMPKIAGGNKLNGNRMISTGLNGSINRTDKDGEPNQRKNRHTTRCLGPSLH